MNGFDIDQLVSGIYRLKWKKAEGVSVAAVGVLPNGDKWLAPTNWVEPSLERSSWDSILSAELICKQSDYYPGNKEKIQTEYEWKRERFELFNKIGTDSETYLEYANLKKWLKENKPENWVACTSANTKVGDKVRNKMNQKAYIIEHLFREMECCSVWFIEQERTIVNFNINAFEIKEGEKCQS